MERVLKEADRELDAWYEKWGDYIYNGKIGVLIG
jgi:hypothetical protein